MPNSIQVGVPLGGAVSTWLIVRVLPAGLVGLRLAAGSDSSGRSRSGSRAPRSTAYLRPSDPNSTPSSRKMSSGTLSSLHRQPPAAGHLEARAGSPAQHLRPTLDPGHGGGGL